jgi:hypothetical protein
MTTTTQTTKRRCDTVRRGSVNDLSFEEGDSVRVRLSETKFGVGIVVAKPAIGRPLYEVEVDGKCVEASWFHIHHHHVDEEAKA